MPNLESIPEQSVPEQIPFGTNDFASNPEPRCPCILLLDVSGSMRGAPIQQLNAGLVTLRDDLMKDELAPKRVEIAIVTFGPVQLVQDFQTAQTFCPPRLTSQADTPMGAAIMKAVELLKNRKEVYKANGIAYYRPWIFLITDGEPTDNWKPAAACVREGEEKKEFAFFAVGVEDADMETLTKISVREPLKLKGLDFGSLFQWLSASMRAVSHSSPGTQTPLTPPTWAAV